MGILAFTGGLLLTIFGFGIFAFGGTLPLIFASGPVLMILGFMIMVVGVYVMYKQWKAASTHENTGITNKDKNERLSA